MASKPRRKSDAARRANQVIRSRTVAVMILLGVCTFGMLFWKLYDLQIRQHEKLQEQAVAQQTRSTVITASRGTLYDRNGTPLAISATAETVFISPQEIGEFVESQKTKQTELQEKAAKKGESYTPGAVRDGNYIARGLGRILGVDEGIIQKKMERTWSQYEIVKLRSEQATADEVRRFINGQIDDAGNPVPEGQEQKLRGVYMEPDSKRYYPYGSLAANVIGFVNGENKGGVGLEAKYESVLEGTSGLTVTAKNARNTDLLYQYEQYYDAQNGESLVLTLDTNVQHSLEKNIESMVKKFNAKNGATGIVMDVNSGAIVGMASYPNYDLNAYGTIYDEKLQSQLTAKLAELEKNRGSYKTEEEYQAAVSKATSDMVQTQWRNKCIDSTYEPGSTFKPLTLAAALEEGVVTTNTTFDCSGSIKVQGWGKPINCSKKIGHGHQTLEQAVGNSCNPAFISMGLKIGTEKYYQYLKAFGLMEPTGVDMIGEVTGLFASEKSFNSNVVSLASYAFGQTFTVTPLHLIRAQAACINGGYLYTPYVVDQELDDDGNIVSQHDSTPIRQVISEETSAKVRQCLEYVVASGTGKNGQVVGYRIGGKTGTADKTGTRTANNPQGDVVVSFMCFAPANDPQYIMLLTMDTPSRNTGVYVSGGNMVAPTASKIMGEILPYLGIEPDYSAEELVGADAAVPNVVGLSTADAKAKMESAGFACRTLGSGDTVTDQTPAGGAIVPNNATIILYLGGQKPDDPCTVPNVVGLTASEANQTLTNAGLIMKVAGATAASSGNVHAISQSHPSGSHLTVGEVVTVQFGDSSVLD
ncbi:penicillin-binding transpeptidase domain-containing protein [Oscillibacter sp.]|uniref:penicillin-binding transpeptidase domain-containing protein n=1 Tax=Oscillibacter sp. TaxID=1945593 RepID=UPI00261BA1AE|nr:penicillin-binding transpeptidase domain-containing protein [Oscillibacter sp.]MDD3346624.1 penicillin-binding transpeptidase domain-containing protein [Oscillibacter sp.]